LLTKPGRIAVFILGPERPVAAGGLQGGAWDGIDICALLCFQLSDLSVRVAFLQFSPAYLQVEANLESVDVQLSSVDADLVVLPELFTSGYFFQSQEDLAEVAEPIPGGRSTEALQQWAASLGATIVAGLPEREGDRFYNSAVVVRPTGDVHTYRKVHLYYEEKALFEPGDLGFRVFNETTPDGLDYRLGVMVCFDWYFPEAARTLALKGADVIAHPSNLVLPHCPDSMPVRARENHVFTITANRHGDEEKDGETLSFIGMSEICDPTGSILERASRSNDVVEVVEFDPRAARERQINAYNDVLADRRPETYVSEKPELKDEGAQEVTSR
jgi:predicted amidohydrolase